MNNLKQIRESKKLTQKVVALAIHVDQSTISKWEDGTHEPNILYVKKLCDYFETDLDTFYGFESKSEKKIPVYTKPRLSDFTTRNFSVYGTTFYHHSSSSALAQLLFEEEKDTSLEIEHKIFSFFLESNDMEPHFLIGDMIFAEEGVLPVNQGNVVVAEMNKPFYIAHASQFDQTVFLHFLDGRQNVRLDLPLKNDSDICVIGKVLECRRKFNQSY